MKKSIKTIVFLLLTIVSITLNAANNVDTSIVVSGVKHKLSVSIPSDYNPDNSYPLIVGLHYCTGYSTDYRDKLSPLCDSLNIIVVCPDNNTEQISNSGFLTISIDTAKSMYNIDTTQVYLTGMSCNGFATLQMGLNNVYPFKGIFPWVPWFNSFSSTTFNLDSEMPVVISVGTLDENYSTILKLYDSLEAHQSDVDLVLVPGVGHDLFFNEFSNEMIRCVNYINDSNLIQIEDVEDFTMINTGSVQEIKIKVTHIEGKELNFRALSSYTSIIANPEIEVAASGDSVTLSILPKENKAGKVHIVLEVTEKEGTAIEQQVFKITVTKPASDIENNTVDNFRIFPVPANKLLFIQSTEQKLRLSICDLNGRIIYNENSNDKNYSIDVSGLDAGIYILRAMGTNTNVSRKIVIE